MHFCRILANVAKYVFCLKNEGIWDGSGTNSWNLVSVIGRNAAKKQPPAMAWPTQGCRLWNGKPQKCCKFNQVSFPMDFSYGGGKEWSWPYGRYKDELDPVGSTVCYEVRKLCCGSVSNSNGWYMAVLSHYEAVIDVIGSVEGIDAFIYWNSGDLVRCHRCLTDWLADSLEPR